MENNQKKLSVFIKLCWLFLILFWAICFISGQKLNVVIHNERLIEVGNFIDKYVVLRYGWSLITYYFNIILVVYTIFRKRLFKYKPFTISLYIILVWVIKTIFNRYAFSSFLDFSYIILIIILDRKRTFYGTIELIKAFLFSLLCGSLKNYVGIQVVNLPTILISTMMIDYYILFGMNYLYSMKRKEDEYAKLGNFLQLTKKAESCKRSFSNFISSCCSNYRSFISEIKTNAWQIYCSIIFFIIVYGSILINSYFCNKMLEATISVICFHIFRHYDSKTYHASTSVRCFIVSTISFKILEKLSPPLPKSIFGAVFLSYILTKVMYYVKDYIDYKYQQKLDVKIKPIEQLLEQEFYDLFNVKFHEQDLKVVYLYIHKKRDTSVDKLALSHNISRSTLYRLVSRVYKYYNELLNSNNKA